MHVNGDKPGDEPEEGDKNPAEASPSQEKTLSDIDVDAALAAASGSHVINPREPGYIPAQPKVRKLSTDKVVVPPFDLRIAKPFSLSECVHHAIFDNAINYFENSFSTNADEMVWEEKPVDFKTFVESKDHMGFMPLSARQLQIVEFMLGDDPNKAFDNANQLAVLALGKGAGKDSLVCLVLLYICYLCLCMRSPDAFFRQPEGENIDCVNVAPSGEKASDVFFEKVKQRVLRWGWLHRKYPVKNSGAFTGQFKPDAGGAVVTVTKDGVIFPKYVRLLSRNSDNESAEGLNILVWVMDEAGAFTRGSQSNADKIYRALRTSATTRFGRRHKGFIIGFPRSTDDFTMKMYNANLGNLHVCTDRGATWEILPQKFAKSQWVDFHGLRIPLEFKEDFEKDPTGMRTMLMADPPEAEHGFIEFPEKISECLVPRAPVVNVEDYIADSRICKRITGFTSTGISTHDYALTIDLGAKSDAAAMSMSHKELVGGKFTVIQDFVTRWKPDKANHYIVSFENMKEFIVSLNSRYHLSGIWFDQWQSFGLQEILTKTGIPSFEYNLTYSDYKTFKEMLYSKRLQLLAYAPQIDEMKKLIDLNTRVDHPRTGCFTGDTRVLTRGGISKSMTEMVADYANGVVNYVYGYDLKAGRMVSTSVLKAVKTQENAELVRVSFTSGASFRCTPNHLFLIQGGMYLPAKDLKAGEVITAVYLGPCGSASMSSMHLGLGSTISGVEILTEREDVYDLEVPETHNFALSNGAVVHNSKDLCDTIVGAVKVLLTPTISGSQDSEWGDVETIESNLYTQDPWA